MQVLLIEEEGRVAVVRFDVVYFFGGFIDVFGEAGLAPGLSR